MLGAIVHWKRPGLALEAAAIASRELPELRIRLAGAPLDPAGHELARELARRAAEPDLAGRARLGEPADASDALARCHVPAALRRERAVRAGDGRGSGQRPSGGRAACRRARWRSWTRAAGCCTSPATPGRRRGPRGGDAARAGAGRPRARARRAAVRPPRLAAALSRSRRRGHAQRMSAPVAINARAAVRREIGRRGARGARAGGPPARAAPRPLPGDRAAARVRAPARPRLGAAGPARAGARIRAAVLARPTWPRWRAPATW